MTRQAVVTLAAVALAAAVFVSGSKAAPPACSSKNCSDDVSVACAGLSGMALKACKTCVLDLCKTAACDCIANTCSGEGPVCNPTTTTTSTSTSSTTSTTAATTTTTSTSTSTSSTSTTSTSTSSTTSSTA